MSAPPPPDSTGRPTGAAAARSQSSCASLPVADQARGQPAPMSDSMAATCRSPPCCAAYSTPPRRPFSSLVNSTTRTVRAGGVGAAASSARAAIAWATPAPSSWAPWPTSQESR